VNVNGVATHQTIDRLSGRRHVAAVTVPRGERPPPATVSPDHRPTRAATVVVADREPLIRAGIRSVLEQPSGLEVVGEAADGHHATELVRRVRPDVLIVDFHLPPTGGPDVAGFVRRHLPETAVIFLAADAVDELIFGALRAGASGFLLKQAAPAELVNAVRAVAAGHAALAPRATRRLIDHFASLDVERVHRARGLIDGLTTREREVLTQVANGMGNLQIARTLHMSEGAVKAHVSRLLTKLNCTNRVQAATLSHHAGLLPETRIE
jgi:DNA-binding NarL/FixJ family response regulator